MGQSKSLYLAVSAAVLGSFQFGYHLGVLNPGLKAIALEYSLTTTGTVMTMLVLGATIGSLSAGAVADCVGLRQSQMMSSAVFVIGSLVSGFTPGGYWGLLAGRFVCGLATGAASLLSPRHLAECSPPSIRGVITSQNQVFICFGILVSFVAGLPAEHGYPHVTLAGVVLNWWRIPLLLAAIVGLIQFCMVMVCAESPVWLTTQGHTVAAKSTFAQLWGPDADVPDSRSTDLEDHLLPTRQEASSSTEDETSLFNPKYRLAVLLAFAIPTFQQLGGINSVIFYSSDILTECGIKSPALGTVLIGGTNLVVTVVTSGLVDSLGRKPLWLLSHLGCGVSLMVLSITALVYGIAGAPLVCMVSMLMFIVCFAVGVGSIPWVYLAEILPSEIKGTAAAIATGLNWMASILVAGMFPYFAETLGVGQTYFVIALMNILAVAFGLRYMVETRKKSLQEIQTALAYR